MHSEDNLLPASFSRRLGAMVYDFFLIIPVLMLVTALWLPFNNGIAIERQSPLYYPMLISQCLSVALFFVYFWRHGGQTLGMRAWRLKIRQVDGQKILLTQAWVRALAAFPSFLFFGLGVLWIIVSPTHAAWHDIISKTEVVLLP